MKYIEKRLPIEALQWDGTVESMNAITVAFPELKSSLSMYDGKVLDWRISTWINGVLCWFYSSLYWRFYRKVCRKHSRLFIGIFLSKI